MNSATNLATLNMDAWADGQTQSKLWLCRELERLWSKKESQFWIYGAWYGTLAQLILLREKLSVKNFDLFDIDSEALAIAKKINTTWEINQIAYFKFHTLDCNKIETARITAEKPDLIINTSCEHFKNFRWFENLPMGQTFLVQSTNMQHPTHILRAEKLEHFIDQLGPLSKIYFKGVYNFNYPENSFQRYMLIGKK